MRTRCDITLMAEVLVAEVAWGERTELGVWIRQADYLGRDLFSGQSQELVFEWKPPPAE